MGGGGREGERGREGWGKQGQQWKSGAEGTPDTTQSSAEERSWQLAVDGVSTLRVQNPP